MEKSKFLCFVLLIFLIAACESNPETKESDSYDSTGVQAIPPQVPDKAVLDSIDSLKAERALKMQRPAQTVKSDDENRHWRLVLNEYHHLLCKVTKNTATETEKERYDKLTADISRFNSMLQGVEHVQFIAAHARAADTKNCR